MYQVTEKDLVEDIQEFPVEVVQKMIEKQVEQGNRANVKYFQQRASSDYRAGGFNWNKTKEGHAFWNKVIWDRNFNIFFKKYPI